MEPTPLPTDSTDGLRQGHRQRGVDTALDEDVLAGRTSVGVGDGSQHVVRRALVPVVVRELVLTNHRG